MSRGGIRWCAIALVLASTRSAAAEDFAEIEVGLGTAHFSSMCEQCYPRGWGPFLASRLGGGWFLSDEVALVFGLRVGTRTGDGAVVEGSIGLGAHLRLVRFSRRGYGFVEIVPSYVDIESLGDSSAHAAGLGVSSRVGVRLSRLTLSLGNTTMLTHGEDQGSPRLYDLVFSIGACAW